MLLSLQNVRQSQEADCLAACAQMVLEHLGIQVEYSRLLNLLGTSEFGTPFPAIEQLNSLGLFVESTTYRDDKLLFARYIELGLPIIIAVSTWALPHWKQFESEHVVIVVGFDDNNVYVNDPYFDEAPLTVPNTDFFAAWSDWDFQYAVIGLVPPE